MRYAVIMAGGSGVRFWPLSRPTLPKQFLALAGRNSLLRNTFDRLLPLVPQERILVVTAAEHARAVRKELPELPRENVLGEPRRRNTAPAIYLAARVLAARDPAANLVVVPSDAWVPRASPYRRALARALRIAKATDNLVLLGVRPTRAETGYGYIDPGDPLDDGGDGVYRVRRFEEKPTRDRAENLFRGGRHLWNPGIFAGRASVWIDAVGEHLPGLDRAFRGVSSSSPTAASLRAAYAKAPTVAVDFGIMEKAANLAVVRVDFEWDDLGSWRALERLGKAGGFERGDVVSIRSKGNISWSRDGVVALVGVEDLIVVHTPEATLVAAKDAAQDVREVVEKLQRTKSRGAGTKPGGVARRRPGKGRPR